MRPLLRFSLRPLLRLPQHRCMTRSISPPLLVGPTHSCGDRLHLSRAITLIESSRESHRAQARALLQEALAIAPPARLSSSFRIGISGPPGARSTSRSDHNATRISSELPFSRPLGVGKSSFIERLGMLLVSKGVKVLLPPLPDLLPSQTATPPQSPSVISPAPNLHLLSVPH